MRERLKSETGTGEAESKPMRERLNNETGTGDGESEADEGDTEECDWD